MTEKSRTALELLSQVADDLALSIAPRVRGALALLERNPSNRDDPDVAAAMLVLQDVLQDLDRAAERADEARC